MGRRCGEEGEEVNVHMIRSLVVHIAFYDGISTAGGWLVVLSTADIWTVLCMSMFYSIHYITALIFDFLFFS